jgi:type II restriction/modification system DNA methylase subunit YeeA
MSINRTALKNYAPKARQDFIAATTARAAKFGITDGDLVPMQEQGDVVIIGGEAFPKKIGAQRKALTRHIKLHGFTQTMEEVAYTWFNRFLAIRYMEVHGYLDHGYRVLSNPDGGATPEILLHAERVDFAALDKAQVIVLKLDGTKDAELYRLLLIAQCNSLHDAMPFMFEKIDDETELLLPDNLLHSDSLIRQLVIEIDEADWQEIEVIGWLYQFYISEKKDQVIGKVVKSEDIPAATQLFTPNWIVKYMVQNSLGHQWMATYPSSSLKDGMEYYIEPAEQTPEVQAQLAEITPSELNPEEMTLLDPAAGSGHILVEAYDLFKQIYLERGYRLKDIPRLILEKNLYGLDIDDRAAQMAEFALLMKARADDRLILSNRVHLNVMAIQSSEGLDAAEIAKYLLPSGRYELVANDDLLPNTLAQSTLAANETSEVKAETLESLINLFEDAKTFGSLITVPENITQALPALGQLLDQPSNGDLLQRQMREHAVEAVRSLVTQTRILGRQYNCVVANPPYMGVKYLTPILKRYLKENFKGYEKDVFSAFIDRNLAFAKPRGALAFMSPFVWMFISTHQKIRDRLVRQEVISSLIQLEYSGFDGATVPICTFTVTKGKIPKFKGGFVKLSDFHGAENQAPRTLEAIRDRNCGWFYEAMPDDFAKIPGSPIAYWVSERIRHSFLNNSQSLGEFAPVKQGLLTTDNNKFIRYWREVSHEKIGFGFNNRESAKASELMWFPLNKGGNFRKWYGNLEFVVDWEGDGKRIHESVVTKYPYLNGNSGLVIKWTNPYFLPGLTWTDISSSYFGARYMPGGCLFEKGGSALFSEHAFELLALLCSKLSFKYLEILNPTLHFQVGNISDIPIAYKLLHDEELKKQLHLNSENAISLSKIDWDSFETSWDFQTFPPISDELKQSNIESSFAAWESRCNTVIQTMKELEENNNRLLIEAYGLQDELTPDVPEDQITLARADRKEDFKRLISYAIGCMMGRYSLAEEGLIYANSGNEGFDPSRYGNFPADDDGIIPITDTEWFDDDATVRLEEFLKLAWSPETLKENLKFIGDSLANNGGNDPLKTIRNYLSKGFYKDHLKTYKKRPIYWLFSSGKQRAFECLVYLHRYNEGTLARMRMEYVTPLQSRISARIEQLGGDVDSASSSAERNRKQKEKDKLVKQLEELRVFDEELRHYADQRIKLILDDGVKSNYHKFGNLLAESKSI